MEQQSPDKEKAKKKTGLPRCETSEKAIERFLCKEVEAAGGKCLKFSSQTQAGYPDRLAIFPCGVYRWVEVKSNWGRLRPLQKERFRELQDLGCQVHVCNTRVDVLCEVSAGFQESARRAGTYDKPETIKAIGLLWKRFNEERLREGANK